MAVGVDVGGTFTDLFGWEETTGGARHGQGSDHPVGPLRGGDIEAVKKMLPGILLKPSSSQAFRLTRYPAWSMARPQQPTP